MLLFCLRHFLTNAPTPTRTPRKFFERVGFRDTSSLAVPLDELENLINRFFEIAANAKSGFNAGPNVPTFQSRHMRAAHLEPKRQLGFFYPLGSEALGQSVCHFALHLPDAI
jgi:hypothetical protein